MAYERQVQIAMERLDQSLAKLHNLVKRNKNKEAIEFMVRGELKERYEELQNIVKISSVNPLGARGAQNTGTL